MKSVTLDAAHVYRDEAGRKVPGVTETLFATVASASWYRGDAPRQFGRQVHLATQYDDEGSLDVGTLDDKIFDRVIAWRAFKRDFAVQVLDIERLVWHPKLRFAGTLDRKAVVGGKKAILDIKTGAQESWFPLQDAAYALALEGMGEKVEDLFTVRLLEGGGYQYHKYAGGAARYRAVFISCLGVYNWKLEHG